MAGLMNLVCAITGLSVDADGRQVNLISFYDELKGYLGVCWNVHLKNSLVVPTSAVVC